MGKTAFFTVLHLMLTFSNGSRFFLFFDVDAFKTVYANSNIFVISEIGQLERISGAFATHCHSTFTAVVLLEEKLGELALANEAVWYHRINPKRPLRFLDRVHPFDEVSGFNLNFVVIKAEFLVGALNFQCESFLLVIVWNLLIVAIVFVNRVHL
jgi:hypothetical protein